MYAVELRENKARVLGQLVLLDPTRMPRTGDGKTASISAETQAAVQDFWRRKTKASPDKRPYATVIDEAGETVHHGVHWQQKPSCTE